ncbi:hypothetical protein [uncultured Maribacter sp.]|uniref:hypothetical protein n=1 Tax=uncultured Maribacter sp. TaxID=431308 RepID=UPI00261DA247|nr:hypothetical protein [uncultured Maribacter sp.]
MKKKLSNLIVLVFLIISVTSVESWSTIRLTTSLTFTLIRTVLLMSSLIWGYYIFKNPFNKPHLNAVSIFLGVIIITGIRSMLIAKGKEQWEFFLRYFTALLSFITVYYLDHPYIFKKINKYWFRIAPLICLLWLPFMSSVGEALGYFLPLLLLYLLFIKVVPNKSKWVILSLTFLIIFICLKEGARSHVLKFGIALLLGFSLYFKYKWFYLKMIKIGRNFTLFAPIILFILGVTNIFNIFKMDEYIDGEFSYGTTNAEGEYKEASLVADTRTFLYEESILSAIKNKTVLFGRSFARGYDSNWEARRQEKAGKIITTNEVDRISEVAVINIFTWMGLLGVFLYFLIFVKATSLAIYHSNNYYIKIVGLFLSFRWMYGWVEDFQRLDISTLTLWMLLAICFSKGFRKLSDHQIEKYMRSIFIK